MTKQKLNPHAKLVKEKVEQLHDISSLASTAGGQTLVTLLIKDTVNAMQRLRASYKTASHTELVTIIADMSARFETAKLLLNAKESEDVANERLEEALRE